MSVLSSSAERPPADAASVVFTAILLASLMHPYMHPAGEKQLSISLPSPRSRAQENMLAPFLLQRLERVIGCIS